VQAGWQLGLSHALYKSVLFIIISYVMSLASSMDIRNSGYSHVAYYRSIITITILYAVSIISSAYYIAKMGMKHVACVSIDYVARSTSLISNIAIWIPAVT